MGISSKDSMVSTHSLRTATRRWSCATPQRPPKAPQRPQKASLLARLRGESRGATTIEYALVGTLLVVGVVAALELVLR